MMWTLTVQTISYKFVRGGKEMFVASAVGVWFMLRSRIVRCKKLLWNRPVDGGLYGPGKTWSLGSGLNSTKSLVYDFVIKGAKDRVRVFFA